MQGRDHKEIKGRIMYNKRKKSKTNFPTAAEAFLLLAAGAVFRTRTSRSMSPAHCHCAILVPSYPNSEDL